MMQSEFENLIGGSVNDEDYQLIEFVYMYYPNIDSKEVVSQLYKKFGIRIFEDMRLTAAMARDFETRIGALKAELSDEKRAYDIWIKYNKKG